MSRSLGTKVSQLRQRVNPFPNPIEDQFTDELRASVLDCGSLLPL